MPAASASYAGEYALSASDLEVVVRVQAEGIGYVRGMLTGDEVAAAVRLHRCLHRCLRRRHKPPVMSRSSSCSTGTSSQTARLAQDWRETTSAPRKCASLLSCCWVLVPMRWQRLRLSVPVPVPARCGVVPGAGAGVLAPTYRGDRGGRHGGARAVSILHEMQSVHRRATRAPHPGVRPHSDQSDWAGYAVGEGVLDGVPRRHR